MSEKVPVPEPEPEPKAPKTYTEEEVAELVSGLKTKIDELLSEKKTAAQKAKEAESARIAAEQEAAKKSGKLDEFERTLRGEYEAKLAEREALLNAATARELEAAKQAVLGGFAGVMVSQEATGLIAQFVRVSSGGGAVKTEFVDLAGKLITTDPAEFKKWMAKDPAISHLMKADVTTGGGATGSKSSAGGAGTISRQQFDALDQYAKQRHIAAGGKVT